MATKNLCGIPFGLAGARFALADLCTGDSIPGPSNGFVTDCLASATATPQIRAGRLIQKESGDSAKGYCVDIRRPDSVVGYTLAVEQNKADIYLESLFTNGSFISEVVGPDTEVKGFIGKTGSTTKKLIIELWEELEFDSCGTGVVPKYERTVYGIGAGAPATRTYSATDNRPASLSFNLQPFTPPTGWTGPFNDFPAWVSTDITNFLTADPAAKISTLTFLETGLPPLSTCGLVTVPV